MSIHTHASLPALLGGLMGISEVLLGLLRRSRQGQTGLDRGSLALFWILIPLSIALSLWAAAALPACRLPAVWAQPAGLALFAAGLGLRWYSIFHLGQWFTVDVAIHAEQPLIDSGPYRFLRHPSYSGALLALIGLGLSCANAASFLLTWLPALPAFIYRIGIEEDALRQAFGKRWQAYCARTRRLLPWVY